MDNFGNVKIRLRINKNILFIMRTFKNCNKFRVVLYATYYKFFSVWNLSLKLADIEMLLSFCDAINQIKIMTAIFHSHKISKSQNWMQTVLQLVGYFSKNLFFWKERMIDTIRRTKIKLSINIFRQISWTKQLNNGA
jgi:hypothetical protein